MERVVRTLDLVFPFSRFNFYLPFSLSALPEGRACMTQYILCFLGEGNEDLELQTHAMEK
jgi:hypothetical protein